MPAFGGKAEKVLSSSLSRWFHRNKKHKIWWVSEGMTMPRRRRFEKKTFHMNFRRDDVCDSLSDNLTNHSAWFYAVINWLWWLLMAPAFCVFRFYPIHSTFFPFPIPPCNYDFFYFIFSVVPSPIFFLQRLKKLIRKEEIVQSCYVSISFMRRSENSKCIHNFHVLLWIYDLECIVSYAFLIRFFSNTISKILNISQSSYLPSRCCPLLIIAAESCKM